MTDPKAHYLRILQAKYAYPDFPKPGVLFCNVTELLKEDGFLAHFLAEVDALRPGLDFDCIAGIESRGFIWGAMAAARLGVPFVPIRKKGKLPGELISYSYTTEYSTDTLEIAMSDFRVPRKVLLVDDVIATGGTLRASAQLIRRAGSEVAGVFAILQIPGLGDVSEFRAVRTALFLPV